MGLALLVSDDSIFLVCMLNVWCQGFYYVCVEFDPHNGLNVTNPRTDDELPLMTHERQSSKTDTDLIQPSPPHSNPSDPHCRWNSGNLEGESTQTATMSGFYFHQHSEP